MELFWLDVASQIDHLAEPWTVTKMARRCGISVSQFIQVSKRLYNRTPVKQLNRLRVEQAAQLLAERPGPDGDRDRHGTWILLQPVFRHRLSPRERPFPVRIPGQPERIDVRNGYGRGDFIVGPEELPPPEPSTTSASVPCRPIAATAVPLSPSTDPMDWHWPRRPCLVRRRSPLQALSRRIE